MIEITSVEVVPVDKGKLRAYINFIIDGCFMVRGAKIIQCPDGFFVAMPSKKRKEATGDPKKDWRDCCHPLDEETRAYAEKVLLEAYYDHIGE